MDSEFPDTLELHPPKPYLWINLVLWTLPLAISVFILVNLGYIGAAMPRVWSLVLSGLVLLLVVPVFSWWLGRLMRPEPTLTLKAEAFMDNGSMVPAGRVEWTEVNGYGLVKYMRGKYLVIFVNHPDPLIQQYKGLKKTMMLAKMNRFKSPVVIPVRMLPENPEKLIEVMSGWGAER